jgi:hypothetical protein
MKKQLTSKAILFDFGRALLDLLVLMVVGALILSCFMLISKGGAATLHFE